MKVLIAEDDATTRLLLERKLRSWGYETVVAADGDEAIAVLSQDERPRLAILDWMMPGLDGVDVCREVRRAERPDTVYLILLTAKGEKTDVVAGLDAGADDYIAKPFDNEELRARLRVGQRVIELQSALRNRIDELQDALAHIKTLQGILPVCSHCHRIRNDKESWERIEQYIADHSDARLSHTLCPECIDKYYPEYAARRRKRRSNGAGADSAQDSGGG